MHYHQWKRERNGKEKGLSDFVKYYNYYVDAVCSNPNQVNDAESSLYQEKWNQFKKLLENRKKS